MSTLNKSAIIIKKGKAPGPTLSIFAGVHGNEKAGILALKKVIKEVKLQRGTVYFVFANPRAIAKDIRQIDKNLNRCFIKNNSGKTWEDQRAKELMKIIDLTDGHLDLHASNSKKSIPFIICEKESFDLARKMDFSIVSYGWDRIEPGATDGYASQQKKVAMCLECGSVHNHHSNVTLAEKSVYQFLQYFNCGAKKVAYNSRKQKLIKAFKAVPKKTNDFSFTKTFNDFEQLKPGQLIAQDGRKKYIAKKDEIIIFASVKANVNTEAFILAKHLPWPSKK